MVHLTSCEWALWVATTLAEFCLIVGMMRSGDSRRWRGLFVLVCILAAKGAIRISAILILKNPYLDFFAYWVGEFAAAGAKVWVTVEIGLALCGISEWSRAIIKRFIPFIALFSTALSLAFAFRDHRYENWFDWLYFIAQRVHASVSLAGLATFLLVAFIADRFSEWSRGVRGIAVGFAIDLTSASYLSWLSLHTQNQHIIAGTRSISYLAALLIWICSTAKPRTSPADHRSLLPAITAYLESYIRIFEVKNAK